MKNLLLKLIDSFYFLFKKFRPLKTYRYAVCGGGNLVLDTILYYICFHYIFAKQDVDLSLVVLSPHIASLFFVFPITFVVGFLLNRFIVFPESNIPAWTQLSRYLGVGLIALLISYVTMKFLVDGLGFYPTPSKVLSIGVTIIFSYLMQSKFSFKVDKS
ncbi:MAG: GtrA family protein [Crocinitomicaceae bacterium]|nr:GtrA family protein [Crocinitomicaceae bacterium]MDP5099678.1 GtrA family protein [Crocinitomicaceae bacterium]